MIIIIIIIIIVPGSNTFIIVGRATLVTIYSNSIQGIIWTAIVHNGSLNVRGVLPPRFLKPTQYDVYTQCVFSSRSFFSNHILFLFFFIAPTPPAHTLFPFVVIDGVRQRSTEQLVANSPRQPASERERERLVCGGGEEEEEEGGD